MYIETAILFVSLVLMLTLSALITKYSIKFAAIFGLGAFTLSFIVMAFITSIPELSIALVSSVNNIGDVGVAIILSSSITNLTLITGLIALFAKDMNVNNIYRQRQALLLIFMAGFCALTILDGRLDRLDGFILILSYFIYLYELWYAQAKEKGVELYVHFSQMLWISIALILAIFALLYTTEVVLDSTVTLALEIGVPAMVIGSLVVSVVAAVPELIYEYRSVEKKLQRFSLGDLTGAVGTNSSLAIALIAITNPFNIEVSGVLLTILFFYIVSILLFLIFMFTKSKLEAKEGMFLIFTYIAFIIMMFLSAVM